jgi:MFS superfamily sulfate permease-like transporter
MQPLAHPVTGQVYLAGDIITWANTKITQLNTLALAAAVLMAIIAVLMAWWKTRSFVATLVALVLAGLVVWAVNNITTIKTKVGSEVTSSGVPAAVAPVVPGPDRSGRTTA